MKNGGTQPESTKNFGSHFPVSPDAELRGMKELQVSTPDQLVRVCSRRYVGIRIHPRTARIPRR